MARALPSRPRPDHEDLRAWGVEWHSRNRLDGDRRHLQWDLREGGFLLFRTRQECRDYIERKFGYIRERPDLQNEPHGWRMPQAVKVRIQRLPRGLVAEREGGYGDDTAAGLGRVSVTPSALLPVAETNPEKES